MTPNARPFIAGVVVGLVVTAASGLLAQAGSGAAGAADAIRQLSEQRLRAQLLSIQPEPAALNPFGDRFHAAVYSAPNQRAVDLITVNGHILCQASSTGESLLGWLIQHRSQVIDVQFETR